MLLLMISISMQSIMGSNWSIDYYNLVIYSVRTEGLSDFSCKPTAVLSWKHCCG